MPNLYFNISKSKVGFLTTFVSENYVVCVISLYQTSMVSIFSDSVIIKVFLIFSFGFFVLTAAAAVVNL